jgi:hypothetical protein
MSRPLLITDCDEVLLHLVSPFRDWLTEAHGIDFRFVGNDFSKSLHYIETGNLVEPAEIWRLLNLFFEGEMHRQYPIEGAFDAIRKLSEGADVVVLTNLGDHHNEARRQQLANLGLDIRVFTNMGPKGPALQKIIAEYAPSRAAFIDDIAQHHASVAELAPDVHRLHLCGEPRLAPLIHCAHEAGHAHARIDLWDKALPWLHERLYGEAHD